MSEVRNVDLVTFENDSVLNQKSISLPIGKVSIRQTAILFTGILVTFLVFIVTDHLIAAGGVFAIFLGVGLIGSKVMTADQMMKSHLTFLVRGTSLDFKPQYLEKKKKKSGNNNNNSNLENGINANQQKTRLQQLEEEQQLHDENNGLVNKVLSEMQSMFSSKKKNGKGVNNKNNKSTKNSNNNSDNRNFSANIELGSQGILNISLHKNKNKKQKNIFNRNKNHDSDTVVVNDDSNKENNKKLDNFLQRLSKKDKKNPSLHPLESSSTDETTKNGSLDRQITITLDGKTLEESQYSINTDKLISLVLTKDYNGSTNNNNNDNHDSDVEDNKNFNVSSSQSSIPSYEITVIADDHNDDDDNSTNKQAKSNYLMMSKGLTYSFSPFK